MAAPEMSALRAPFGASLTGGNRSTMNVFAVIVWRKVNKTRVCSALNKQTSTTEMDQILTKHKVATIAASALSRSTWTAVW